MDTRIFKTFIIMTPNRGLVTPFIFFRPGEAPIIIEVYYNYFDCAFREVMMGLPEGVEEVNLQDLKNEKL